jgi:hypothetical protein
MPCEANWRGAGSKEYGARGAGIENGHFGPDSKTVPTLRSGSALRSDKTARPQDRAKRQTFRLRMINI